MIRPLQTFSIAAVLVLMLGTQPFGVAMEGGEHGGDHGGDHGGHGVSLKTGRYTGLLETKSSGVKIVANLDLFYTQENAEYPKLSALLKLRFGSVGSPEYVSYLYEKVLFDPNTNLLTFDSNSTELTITKLMIHGEMLMGEFRSNSTGQTGAINLDFKRSFDPKPVDTGEPPDDDEECLPGEPCGGPGDEPGNTPAPPPDHGDHGGGHAGHFRANLRSPSKGLDSLAGDYRGKCDGETQVLQLITNRSTDALEKIRNPFATYHVSGNLGRLRDRMKVATYTSASYDFFSGALALTGFPTSLSCRVQGNRITCGKCAYERIASAEALSVKSDGLDYHERKFTIDRSAYQLIEGTPEPSDISGDYFGYLHHELLDQYQPVRLNLNAYLHTDVMHGPAELYISPLVDLFFGSFGSSEKILYRFNTRKWLYTAGAMLIEGEEETFGVVREWRKGMVLIDWYSRNFGRVGTIELVKGKMPAVPSGARVMATLSGNYAGPIMHFGLQISDSGDLEEQPANPFFPLKLTGQTQIRSTGPKIGIEDGSFDFYTGAFTIHTLNGNRLTGIRTSNRDFLLFITGVNSYASPHMPMRYDNYTRK